MSVRSMRDTKRDWIWELPWELEEAEDVEDSAERLHWALHGPFPLTNNHCNLLRRNSKQPCILHCALHCGTAECYQEWQRFLSPLDPCLHCRIFTRGRKVGIYGQSSSQKHREFRAASSWQKPRALVSFRGHTLFLREPIVCLLPHVPQSRC